MQNVILGRYLPYNTVIHRLDPRFKIIAMLALLIASFQKMQWVAYGVLALFTLLLLLTAKVKLKTVFKSLKAMWFMIVVILIFNVILIKTGDVLFTIGTFPVYVNALLQTATIAVRLTLMISITTILTATTRPLDLTYGLEFYMTPLKVFHFPAHEIAMTISVALRFIPTLLEETEKIMKAQASRGVDLNGGSFKSRISGVIALIIPLFVSSFERSEELANAMEARGYNPSGKRTRYRVLKFSRLDVIGFIILTIVVAAVFILIYNPAAFGMGGLM